MQLRKLASSFVVFAVLMAGLMEMTTVEPDNTVIITLKGGDAAVALRPNFSPKHVAQIKT